MASAYSKGMTIKAGYWTSVYKAQIGGWRQEWVDAVLEVVSPGMAVVKSASMSEAGSHRQQYHVAGVEAREVGAKKRISSLSDVQIVEVA